jgi:hypothetical protein
MAGRSWPSLTSDMREHEWIGVHQLRLDRKRRRRASVPMRPPYGLVIRLNVAGEPRRVEEWAGVVVAQEFLPQPPRKDLLIYRNDDRAVRPRECADAPPFVSPELSAAHRVWCTGLSPLQSTSPTL